MLRDLFRTHELVGFELTEFEALRTPRVGNLTLIGGSKWASTTGSEGVALMLLAARRGDTEMAKLAAQQIEAAFPALRDGGDAPLATKFEAQLPKARALAQKLAKR